MLMFGDDPIYFKNTQFKGGEYIYFSPIFLVKFLKKKLQNPLNLLQVIFKFHNNAKFHTKQMML
jgi:hypothetical protein